MRRLSYDDLGVVLDDVVLFLGEEPREEGGDIDCESCPHNGREELERCQNRPASGGMLGPHTLAGHHLRKMNEAIRRATELTTVAVSGQAAIL